MPSVSPSPSRITARKPAPGPTADTPDDWYGGDAFLSRLFEGLSLSFPAGEKYFIDSVRAYRDRISDPRLAEDVRGFVAQESQHVRGHAEMNDWLRARGLPADELLGVSQANADRGRRLLPPLLQLASTAALEHYTAMLASCFAENPGSLERIHEDVRLLWVWHALEEIEHKSVAFDVYEHVGGRYPMRAVAMILATVQFAQDAHYYQRRLQESLGVRLTAREWARGYQRVFGPGGPFRGFGRRFVDYLRPDFHPSQHDDAGNLERLRALYESELAARDRRTSSRAA